MTKNEIGLKALRAALPRVIDRAEHHGETTLVTRNGRIVAQITPYTPETLVNVTLDDIIGRIQNAGWANGTELAEGIDFEAAAKEIRDTYGLVDVDTIPSDEFWAIVAKHDATQQERS